jgi:hypothetical protein
MKVTIKKSKISMALLKQLEAAGITVTLILSSVAGAQDIQRGDLAGAIEASRAELVAIAQNDPDSFDMEHLEEVGALEYMCGDLGVSAELDLACSRAMALNSK